MKKWLPLLFLLTAWLPAQNMNLENAIERSVEIIQTDLSQGTSVAVLNFTSSSGTFSNYVMQELSDRLVSNQRLRSVDRGNLTLVRQMMNVQTSNNLSNESARTIGQMLGVQSVVFGDIADFGGFHLFRVRAIDVRTAAIQTQLSFELMNDPQLTVFMGNRRVTAFPQATYSVTVPSSSR